MFLMSESTTTSTVHPWPHQPGANDTADDDWLLPLQERRSLFGDLRFILRHELWRHRGLLYELMRRDIRIRYKQAVMGLAWAVLMPILIVAAGALVRVAMAFVGGRPLVPQEVMGIAMKAVPWSFFVGALGFAINSLTGNSNLVTKIYFPREVLPLAATLAQVADSAIGLSALLVAGLLLGVHFGAAALWAPALLRTPDRLHRGLGAGRLLRQPFLPRCQVHRPGAPVVRHLLHAGVLRAGDVRSDRGAADDAEPAGADPRRAASERRLRSQPAARRWSRPGVKAASWCGRPGISFPVRPGPP